MTTEHAIVFECQGAQLSGVLHEPAAMSSDRGVLVVVGGPQYRAGSHRQFVLLSRALAAEGIAVMRFDHRGVGDSDGDTRAFTRISDDIEAAVSFFLARMPALRSVVIWGLCDAASAAMMYAHRDERVSGLVLLNPWVRNPEAQARAYLRTYYIRRLFDGSFWRSLLTGKVSVLKSMGELAGHARRALPSSESATADPSPAAVPAGIAAGVDPGDPRFVEDMREGLRGFKGPVLVVLSGEDLTAQEFRELVRSSRDWRRLLEEQRVTHRALDAANHTFSRAAWRDQVARWTREWLRT